MEQLALGLRLIYDANYAHRHNWNGSLKCYAKAEEKKSFMRN